MTALAVFNSQPVRSWLLALLLGGGSMSALGQIYTAGFADARWQVSAGAFACSLRQDIPGYGAAVLARASTTAETLVLQQNSLLLAPGPVTLAAVPPAWRTDLMQVQLAYLEANSGKEPLKLSGEQIAKLVGELHKGMRLVFSGVQALGSGSGIHIALEPKSFDAAYKKYSDCLAAMIPYSFQQLARTLISYPAQATGLSPAAKAELDKIARYAKADTKVLGIIVDAHAEQLTDSDAADAASKLQAEWVTQYLVTKGIKAEQITTRWHGAKFPIASNANESGRAKNRRVIVRMETAATRLETEQKLAALKAAEAKAAAEDAAKQSAPASSAAPLPSALERLVNMVDAQDLNSGKMPQMSADDLR